MKQLLIGSVVVFHLVGVSSSVAAEDEEKTVPVWGSPPTTYKQPQTESGVEASSGGSGPGIEASGARIVPYSNNLDGGANISQMARPSRAVPSLVNSPTSSKRIMLIIAASSDTFETLSRRYNVTVAAILRANNYKTPFKLQPGQPVKIPRRVTIK